MEGIVIRQTGRGPAMFWVPEEEHDTLAPDEELIPWEPPGVNLANTDHADELLDKLDAAERRYREGVMKNG